MSSKSKKTILVGIDFTKSSENALNYAIMLAERSGSSLLLFHVFDTPMVHTNSGAYFIEYASLKHNNISRLEEYKKKIQAKNKTLVIDVFTTFASFKEGAKDLVKKGKVSYIVLGLETKTKISKYIYGTTGVDIAGKVECPVIIVPEKYKEHKLSKTLLALDNEHKQDLKALKKYGDFIQTFKCNNVNLHVRTEDELLINRNEKKNIHLEVEVVEAVDFKTGLTKFTKTNKVDLITLISHSHSFLYNLFSETNTKTVAFHSKVPVMSIHD